MKNGLNNVCLMFNLQLEFTFIIFVLGKSRNTYISFRIEEITL